MFDETTIGAEFLDDPALDALDDGGRSCPRDLSPAELELIELLIVKGVLKRRSSGE